MFYKLENVCLAVQVNDLGAELTRVTDRADGYEFLWSGDPAVWSGRSPLLFPIVGKLKGDRYTHAGQTYSLPKHGFARREVFRCAKQDARRSPLCWTTGRSTRRTIPSAGRCG